MFLARLFRGSKPNGLDAKYQQLKRYQRELRHKSYEKRHFHDVAATKVAEAQERGVAAAERGDAEATYQAARDLELARAELHEVDRDGNKINDFLYLVESNLRRLDTHSESSVTFSGLIDLLNDSHLQDVCESDSSREEDLQASLMARQRQDMIRTRINLKEDHHRTAEVFKAIAEARSKGDAETVQGLMEELGGKPSDATHLETRVREA